MPWVSVCSNSRSHTGTDQGKNMNPLYCSYSTVIFTSLSLLLFTIPSSASVKDEEQTSFAPHRIPGTEERIRIDGVLDDVGWNNALVIELNFEISPSENTSPPVKTEAYLIHNKNHLYVGLKAFDPDPSAIRAHLSDRDDISGDDSVSIVLDTFNDELRAFQFECNPLGIQRDVLQNDAGGGRRGGGDESWDAIWDSAGRTTEWGYLVEMAIPFNALSFPRDSGEQIWGVIVSREYPRNVTHNIRNVPEDRSRKLCDLPGHQGGWIRWDLSGP